MDVFDKAVNSSWEDITNAATDLLEVDLVKKKKLFEKLLKKRSELFINVADVNADLQLQSLRIEKYERKLLSFKEKGVSSQSKGGKKAKMAKSTKKRDEISDLLEKEKEQALKKNTYLTGLQKKLERIDRKVIKLKSSTVEELKLAKVNKKLGRQVRDLENSVQSQSSDQQPPEPEKNSVTASTICPFEAPFHSLIEFLSNFISFKASSLECPVCYNVPSPPIYRCPNSHIICSSCLPRLSSKCPTCRTRFHPGY